MTKCIICGQQSVSGKYCSGRCNNQAIRMARYARERLGLNRLWRPFYHYCLKTNRFWLHLGEQLVLGIEWVIGHNFCHIKFEMDSGDHDFGVSLCMPGVGIFVNLELPWNWRTKGECREWKVAIHHGSLWWTIGIDDRGSYRGWRSGCWHFVDWLLGKMEYHSTELKKERRSLIIEDDRYEATVTVSEVLRKRARWWGRISRAYDIDIDGEGISIPGRGESEWDCGPDSIQSYHCEAANFWEAEARLRDSVLRRRYEADYSDTE